MRISSALWEALTAHILWYWVMRELAEALTKQLCCLSAVLLTREVPVDVG